MIKFKCYLFDLDGTLICTHELICQSLIDTIYQFTGKEVKKEVISGLCKESPRTILKTYGIADLKKYWNNYNKNIGLANYYFHDTLQILNELKKGALIGIVSSLPKTIINNLLLCFKLDGLFDIIVGWSYNLKAKPSPSSIIYAAEKLGISYKDTIYVGNENKDIIAAKKAGVVSGLATWGKEEIIDIIPDYYLRHINELRF